MDPEWNAHLHAAALPEAATVEQPERRSEPGSDDPKTPEDFERLAQVWNKLWNS